MLLITAWSFLVFYVVLCKKGVGVGGGEFYLHMTTRSDLTIMYLCNAKFKMRERGHRP